MTKEALSLTPGAKISPIIPKDIEEVYRLANMCVKSGLAPSSFNGNAPGICMAILTGLEIGVPPMQAIQGIAVINGRPTIWGDLAIAIVQASPVCEYIKESYDQETGTAYCEVKRSDRKNPVVMSFSRSDAKQAGLLSKKGPWQTYPKRMLQMRARSWALRDEFSDVLKGLRIREEEEDSIIDVTPQSEPEVPSQKISPPPAPSAPQIQQDNESDTDEYIAEVEEKFAVCQTAEQLNAALVDSRSKDLDDDTNARVLEMFDLYRKGMENINGEFINEN
jgi:hypothetical protein